MGTVPMGTVEAARMAARVASRSPPVDRSITVSAPQRSAQLQLLHLVGGAGRHRARAHVGVDLGEAGAADGHGVQVVLEVHPVGRDDHAARGHLVAHLLGR
jgi:hypothetical protein